MNIFLILLLFLIYKTLLTLLPFWSGFVSPPKKNPLSVLRGLPVKCLGSASPGLPQKKHPPSPQKKSAPPLLLHVSNKIPSSSPPQKKTPIPDLPFLQSKKTRDHGRLTTSGTRKNEETKNWGGFLGAGESYTRMKKRRTRHRAEKGEENTRGKERN